MYSLDAGSIGPQFGGSSTDYVVLVMSEPAAKKILSGKWKLGADAGAYLGSSGAITQGLNDPSLARRSSSMRALTAASSLERPSVTPPLQSDGKVTVPDAAHPFMAALSQTSKSN